MKPGATQAVVRRIAAMVCGWLAAASLAAVLISNSAAQNEPPKVSGGPLNPLPGLGEPLARDPIFVYNNWSAYDELSDNVLLTEQLAMKELDEILRLRRLGVRIDYYTIDAFWFDPDGSYRTWRKPSWPNGPDAWIRKCRENGILPGLWFSTNTLVKINAAPEWRESLNENKGAMSFSEGGFLPNFMETLQYWYDRGIRIYKFDFVDFGAATPETARTNSPAEIRARNEEAFRDALQKFRQQNPDVVLVAFNGFGGDVESTAGPFPFHNVVDLRWLEVFDSMYSGDPRPSDVPEMNFWRSVDIYSDHMVRRYQQSFLPLERVDSTGFMLGNTGTIYYRKTHAWKGALILMMARGGWVNTIYGSLEFLTDDDARWFAKAQSLYRELLATGRSKTFGGIPGEVQPYGFGSLDSDGAVYAVVNPAQSVEEIQMARLSREQPAVSGGRILFRDAGFMPILSGDPIKLGPGQMALVGFGKYASAKYDLGVQEDVRIPQSITQVAAKFTGEGNVIRAEVTAPAKGDLRIVMQQRSAKDGSVMRSWKGGPPNGTNMGKVFVIKAWQAGKPLPVEIDYDKVIWSGLSWAVGEIRHGTLKAGDPVQVECTSTGEEVRLEGKVYAVVY
ncbi:conserved exported hypothetical protein [Candidatus Sulfotelmatobacter kueseliae]|uniref:Alpha-galactosidase n=1 Tax=Candidatus Sulfotelmatobacter kueseliae TaxID=2042962 RepID=A0A2U3KQT3_9BACT|nr:conserved exported hypothetical protein [Candidatus Sulfotelmatobacter kueseliae]